MSDRFLDGLREIKRILTTDSVDQIKKEKCGREYLAVIAIVVNKSTELSSGLDQMRSTLAKSLDLTIPPLPHAQIRTAIDKVNSLQDRVNYACATVGATTRYPHLAMDEVISLHLINKEIIDYNTKLFAEFKK